MTTSNLSAAFFAFAGLAFACGCSHLTSGSGRPEAWLKEVPVEVLLAMGEGAEMANDRIFQLSPVISARVEGRLRSAQLIELESREATELVGRPLPSVPGTKPFLVRGLSRNEESGSFQCFYSNGNLIIAYGAMGKRLEPMHRRPIVVLLGETPKRIFVSCSVLE